MVDNCLATQSGKRAAISLCHAAIKLGQAFHMRFIDNCIFPSMVQRVVCVPVKSRVGNHTFGHKGRGVTRVLIHIRSTDRIAIKRVIPRKIAAQFQRIGVKKQLRRIEPMTLVWRVRSMDPISVTLPGPNTGQIAIPDATFHLRKIDTKRFDFTRFVVKAKLYSRCIFGKKGKVGACFIWNGPKCIAARRSSVKFGLWV